MVVNGENNLILLLGNEFIKDVYLGNDQILGFNNQYSLNDEDTRINKYNLIEEDFDFYLNTNGYIKFNGVCCKLICGMGGVYSPGGASNFLDIYIKDFNENILYRYNITVSSFTNVSKFTYKFTLFDSEDVQIKSTEWTTDYAFSSTFDIFKYDFEHKQWIFEFISGGPSSSKQTYSVMRKYMPCKIEINNVANKKIKVDFSAIMQD